MNRLVNVYTLLLFAGRQMQSYIAQEILEMLDCDDLANAQQVSGVWEDVVTGNQLWKKLYDRQVCETQ